ncbi:DUF4232 domain-containing protein [Streptomyces benahoarensis]|uniref:DUF4232 domain-containing protein n=1 Tax=Streptomyces benahoarensis TaxID=2595054 RepID=A0A553Z9A1_9ACTN|nr:DUF4232 domain-containing protein [Streptomyces benahoarensis]TSB15166.1 DUF4232 domain-containing protein [Streptomyces benahoarensis]TSB38023.1 DUF4232 domain-containing protein [Streptomyces benahoarensis]
MRTALRTRSALGLASVAVLSLSLTACDGGADGSKASESASSSAARSDDGAGTDKASDSSPARAAKKGDEAQAPSSAAPAKDPKSDGGSAGDDCVLGTTEIALKEAGGMPSAVLLTATNNGSTPCSVYNAPFVSDPVAGHNLTVDQDSKPQAVVTVAPGRTAYAAITLAQKESTQNHRTKSLTVTLATKANSGTDGHYTVSSPGPAGLQINPSTRVTYWQSSEEDALK